MTEFMAKEEMNSCRQKTISMEEVKIPQMLYLNMEEELIKSKDR